VHTSTSCEKIPSLSVSYSQRETVMQSVAMLQHEKNRHIFTARVCCKADAQKILHPL
jgi:hypothetical protein